MNSANICWVTTTLEKSSQGLSQEMHLTFHKFCFLMHHQENNIKSAPPKLSFKSSPYTAGPWTVLNLPATVITQVSGVHAQWCAYNIYKHIWPSLQVRESSKNPLFSKLSPSKDHKVPTNGLLIQLLFEIDVLFICTNFCTYFSKSVPLLMG